MFNRRRSNLQIVGVMLLVGFVVQTGQIFATDDSDFNLIADMLHTYVANREQTDYLNTAYTPKFQMDPFGAIVEDLQSQAMEPVLGGMQEIVAQVQKRGCGISQKNLTAILYYFDEGFRSEMLGQLGRNSNLVFKQIPEPESAERACVLFNSCYYGGQFQGSVMTDCKEKMVWWYREGYQRKGISQGVKLVQLGKDKYWNTSLEDSPYDLFYDVSAISKIMFEDIQEPPQFFFFQMPTFLGQWGTSFGQGGRDNFIGNTNNGSSRSTSSSGRSGAWTTGNENWGGGQWAGGWWGWWWTTNPWAGDDEFMNFLDTHTEAGNYQTSSPSTVFGGNSCEDPEQIEQTSSGPTLPSSATDAGVFIPQDDDITDQEYTEYIDDVVDQFNAYFDFPVSDPWTSPVSDGRFLSSDGSNLGSEENEIRSCLKKCEGLQLDKKAACVTMCFCDERQTPRFDPYKTPGLWPIMVVEFCAVPPTAKEFSQRGRLIMGIESAFNEIFGVVDTMDKGGELWIFLKQKAFLDSSTKEMKFGKMVTFSIAGMVKKKAPDNGETEKYVLDALKTWNEAAKGHFEIVSRLDDPLRRNANALVQTPGQMNLTNTFAADVDRQVEVSKYESLGEPQDFFSNIDNTTRQEQYVALENQVADFVRQHSAFWQNATSILKEMEITTARLAAK